MSIKNEVAYGIVRGFTEMRNCKELQDFTVKCGLTEFRCHKFVLAACSGYFRRLFTSGMKGADLKCVKINNISSWTFDDILESIYTGRSVLTNANVIDIWHATHQLHITLLTEDCDAFVLRSLSLHNYETYWHHANLLNNEHALEFIWRFITNNFDSFSSTKSFLGLSIKRFLKLVNCDDLKVTSQDILIKSILRWVDHPSDPEKDVSSESSTIVGSDTVPIANTKDRYLVSLLSAARTCLCSLDVLKQTLQHPKVKHNHKAQDIILKAILNNLEKNQNGDQLSPPPSAIPRDINLSDGDRLPPSDIPRGINLSDYEFTLITF